MVGSTIGPRALPAANHGPAGLRQLARTLRRSIARLRPGRRRRVPIGEMKALHDHLLADIGLTRAHIAYAEYASRHGQLAKGWNHGLCR